MPVNLNFVPFFFQAIGLMEQESYSGNHSPIDVINVSFASFPFYGQVFEVLIHDNFERKLL